MPKASYPAQALGSLPERIINAALGTELSAGQVRLSTSAHRHMAKDHPDDYPVCIAALAKAIKAPTFIGQAPGHGENFEIIYRLAGSDGQHMLVAIGLEPDEAGNYRVCSCYLISKITVEKRRQAGRLKIARP